MAEYPTRVGVDERLSAPFLVLPNTSSERRDYIPIGWLTPEVIANQRASCETRDRPSFFLAGGGGARDGQRAGCSVRRMAVTAPGKPATRGFMEPACRL